MARNRHNYWLVMVALLWGCGASPEDRSGGGAPPGVQGVDPIPPGVRRVLDNPVPEDGKVHVLLTSGTVDVNPDTIFCGSVPLVDKQMVAFGIANVGLVGMEEYMESLGQSKYLDGSPRMKATGPKACLDPAAIRHRGYALQNGNGRPFKLLLAVWQGENAWVGGIARDLDPHDSTTWGDLPHREYGPRVDEAIRPSIEDLSREFRHYLARASLE